MFFKKVRGRCGCVYGTKGAVDRKNLGTTALYYSYRALSFEHITLDQQVHSYYTFCIYNTIAVN
jgi:hypothetical protein